MLSLFLISHGFLSAQRTEAVSGIALPLLRADTETVK